jgi:hypothetical protein
VRDGGKGGVHVLGARDRGARQLGRAHLAATHPARELHGVVVGQRVVTEGVHYRGHRVCVPSREAEREDQPYGSV